MKYLLLLGLCPFLFFDVSAQNSILLNNHSFEDTPKSGQTPSGWYNCGFPGESPGDIQPGSFNVSLMPKDGNSYLGLVVRDNETYEAVGQRLPSSLTRGSYYTFSIWMARAELYVSQSQVTKEPANYIVPAKLRIWGGNGYCDKAEMLYETPIITNFNWMQYNILIQPLAADYSYITLEAYYQTPVLFPYNGNILLDNCSLIEKITEEQYSKIVPREASPDSDETAESPRSNGSKAASLREPDPKNIAVIDPGPKQPNTIRIWNSSFETPPPNFLLNPLPSHWETIPYPEEILPRSHPEQTEKMAVKSDKDGFFTVPILKKPKAEAQNGDRYMSLLARKDGTRQWISQALEKKMEKDSSYVFSLFLMHSNHFKEVRLHGESPVDYKSPVRLRIWGGNEVFRKEEVLAESVRVEIENWKKHVFVLNPKKQHYAYLTLEAWYAYDEGKTYDGNILIDACSNLVKVSKSNN